MIDDIGIIIAFYVLAGTSVVCALLVAFARNLIHAVLFLALTFVGVAGVYVVLSADFVAVVQVLIYAGAVGVLMTFAIMLTPASDRQNSATIFQIPAALLGLMVAGVAIFVAYDTDWTIANRPAFTTTARAIGDAFLQPYVVAFEVASVLLVTAMIGAIILTGKSTAMSSNVILATLPMEHVLIFGAVLFGIGLYVALSKRNAVGILMGVELMMNAVNVTLLAFSRYIESPRPIDGQVFATFVITIAAAEAAVALALCVAIYRHRETVNIDEIDLLRW